MRKLVPLLLLLVLLSAGCRKQCQCTRYDGSTVTYYSQDEVSAQGKTCADMKYINTFAAQYYSYCEWK